jgi:hypothetical protein
MKHIHRSMIEHQSAELDIAPLSETQIERIVARVRESLTGTKGVTLFLIGVISETENSTRCGFTTVFEGYVPKYLGERVLEEIAKQLSD